MLKECIKNTPEKVPFSVENPDYWESFNALD